MHQRYQAILFQERVTVEKGRCRSAKGTDMEGALVMAGDSMTGV